jgi:hypothetical protein
MNMQTNRKMNRKTNRKILESFMCQATQKNLTKLTLQDPNGPCARVFTEAFVKWLDGVENVKREAGS